MAEDIRAEKHEAPSDFDDVDPEEELDDIQWLRLNYRLVLDRELNLLEYLAKTLVDFDRRITALEDKYEGG